MSLYLQGISQNEAHIIASEKFNYAQAASDFYADLKLKQKKLHKTTPLSLNFLMTFKSKFKSMINRFAKKVVKQLKNGGR